MAVKGLSEFQRSWGNIPAAVKKNVAAELEDIADEIVAQMFGMAPQLTGDLAASIRWTWGDAPSGGLVIGEVADRKHGGMRITIFAGGEEATRRQQARASGNRARDQSRGGTFDQDVARLQEFGTSKMPANPFFFPVWRANKRRVKGRVSRAISKAIRTA